VFDPEVADADLVFEARDVVQWRPALGQRDAGLEGQRVAVAPDAVRARFGRARAAEILPRRQVRVPHLQQSVTVVAGVPDRVERGERLATLDAGQPDAVVGDPRHLLFQVEVCAH